jgi:hypothetical protein
MPHYPGPPKRGSLVWCVKHNSPEYDYKKTICEYVAEREARGDPIMEPCDWGPDPRMGKDD